ncbi:PAS domain-containing serine/threonine-protein kinase [Aphelenchoides fujianensis]|nr:PAS domain-containing serine/threonine-protein kinase [Aphelenchoides fujianensis]
MAAVLDRLLHYKRKFNFRDHACGEEAARIPSAGQSGGEERRLNFTCGTTPIVASSSPQIQHHETLNSSACESAVGSPQPAASSHCNGCLSKSGAGQKCGCERVQDLINANRQAAMLPIQPHHNAQHAMNHQCNDATNCRWLILMEPINALHINVILGAKGRIFRTDDSFAAVLGYDCTNRLFGTEIRRLIPSLKTDPELSGVQQQCCGCSTKRNGIPFSAIVVVEFDNEQNPLSFDVQIRSLASINGIITITDAGVVHQYNDNFLHELIGLDTTADENVMLITEIIPGFYESSTIASLSAAEQTGTTLAAPVVLPARQHSQSESLAAGGPELDDDELAEDEPSSGHTRAKTEDETAGLKRFNSVPTIQVGSFYGLARHVDGILIPIRFDVTRIDGQSSPRLYAVGIGYERGMDYGFNQVDPTGADENAAGYTRQSSSSAAESDDAEMRIMKLADPDDDQSAGLEMRIHDVTLSALADESNEAVRGEYSTFYDTFQLIGNGTFGSVKLAARKDSGLLAVTKFVCKDKVLPESWVRSPVRENKMIPIEVHLLETLNHKNIVKVLDVFENDKYYQLVMEKLGCGMDLFEFIENHPQLDEKLTSWSLGILLYTLVFYQNPFRTPQETVHADLEIPWKISEGLYQVISSLLTPNPNQRATINDLVHHWWVQQPMDPANYRFRDVVRNSERARVSPPLYVSDLHNHLKNASSCGNLANNSTLSLADSHSTNNVLQPQESGVVSAR